MIHVRLDNGVHCVTFKRSLFRDGKWMIYALGGNHHLKFQDVEFAGGYRTSRNMFGDGLKTGGKDGVKNFVFERLWAHDMVRNAIDTTGGFEDALIIDSLFERIEDEALDFKLQFKDKSALAQAKRIKNVWVRNSRFVDTKKAITATTGFFNGIPASQEHAVTDVHFENCGFSATKPNAMRCRVLLSYFCGDIYFDHCEFNDVKLYASSGWKSMHSWRGDATPWMKRFYFTDCTWRLTDISYGHTETRMTHLVDWRGGEILALNGKVNQSLFDINADNTLFRFSGKFDTKVSLNSFIRVLGKVNTIDLRGAEIGKNVREPVRIKPGAKVGVVLP